MTLPLKQKIEAYLESKIVGNVHKGAFAIYGNTNDPKTKTVASAGFASPGKRYNKDTIIRLASQSKFIGALAFAKCLEMNIITFNDPVGKYLEEFKDKQFQYYNPDGTIASDTVNSNDINLGHLVSMSTGLNYYFISWGNLYPIFNSLIGPDKPLSVSNKVRNTAINNGAHNSGQFTDWQFDTTIYNFLKNGGKFPSFKRYVQLLTTVPLAFKPGTNSMRETVYGLDMDVLGACLNVAVQSFGYSNIYEFFKKNFLCPMNINDMFTIGNPDRPADTNSRLSMTAFRRPPGNKQPDGTVFAADPSPEYLANKAGQLVWANEYEDGFRYNELLFTLYGPNHFEYDPYQGYFGAGWISSLTSFCKLFELVANDGLYRGKRIINAESLKMIFIPTLPEYTRFGLARFNNPQIANFTSPLANPANEGLFAFGYNEHWTIGNAMGNSAFADALYAHKINKDSIRWGSYYGTSYICDIESGNYLMVGVQEDANSLKVDDSSNWIYEIFLWLNEPQPNCCC